MFSPNGRRGRVVQGIFQSRPFSFAAVNPGAGHSSAVQRKPVIQCRPGVDAFQVDLCPKSGGWPLPRDVQAKMEAALGANFSDVRVHVGPEASAIGAIAFTWGSDVHFAPGQYNPHTPHGQFLLGHELAHVVQQRAGRVVNPFGGGVAVVQDQALEAEADRLGRMATSRPHIETSSLQAGSNQKSQTVQRITHTLLTERGHSYSNEKGNESADRMLYLKSKAAAFRNATDPDIRKRLKKTIERQGGVLTATGDLDETASTKRVKYAENPNDVEKNRVYVDSGLLHWLKDDELVDTYYMVTAFSGPKFAIYVMDQQGRIYIHSHKIGWFHHSSFLGGGNVAAAGEIVADDGEVRAISNKSGHYHPGEGHLVQFIHQLRRDGIPLNFQVIVYKGGTAQPDVLSVQNYLSQTSTPDYHNQKLATYQFDNTHLAQLGWRMRDVSNQVEATKQDLVYDATNSPVRAKEVKRRLRTLPTVTQTDVISSGSGR